MPDSNVKKVIFKKLIAGQLTEIMDYRLANAIAEIAVLQGTGEGSIKKQIQDATQGLSTADGVVAAVVQSATNGAISVTKGSTTTDVKVTGVVTVPTYDAETRKITLPFTKADGTADSVVVNLGKDLVVKSGALDATKENIVLTLSNDDTVSIPVKSLVDVYTGGTTSSAVVTVGEDNVIKAQVRVSSKEGNKASIVTEAGKEGVYVEGYDDTALKGRVSTLETDNATNKADIAAIKTKNESQDEAISIAQSTAETASEGVEEACGLARARARILVSATQPTDLTDKDLWLQEVTE